MDSEFLALLRARPTRSELFARPSPDQNREVLCGLFLSSGPGLKSLELTGEWEAKMREVERGGLDPRRFMTEIVGYTGEVIRCGDATSIDEGRLGDCPRCGRPVIAGKRGFGCSGWREGCPFVLWREYKGHALGDEQIRQLLQRRVLLGPLVFGESGEVVLQLLDNGELTEIPIPVGGQRRRARETGFRSAGRR